MNVTLQQLRSFLGVAQELHFGRAAQKLNVSSSGLSEQISTLERRLGVLLFSRAPRQVALTEAGTELVDLARKVSRAMDDVESWAAKRSRRADLRIGMMASSPAFQKVMAAAAQRLTQVQWQIRQLGFVDCRESLLNGEVDCAFVSTMSGGPGEDIEAIELWSEPCVVVMPKNHALANHGKILPDQLRGEALICSTEESQSLLWLEFLREAVEGQFRRIDVARNFEEVLELCAAGVGVNICAESASVSYARPGLVFVPLVGAPSIETSLWLRWEREADLVEEFARIAVATIHEAQ